MENTQDTEMRKVKVLGRNPEDMLVLDLETNETFEIVCDTASYRCGDTLHLGADNLPIGKV